MMPSLTCRGRVSAGCRWIASHTAQRSIRELCLTAVGDWCGFSVAGVLLGEGILDQQDRGACAPRVTWPGRRARQITPICISVRQHVLDSNPPITADTVVKRQTGTATERDVE